MSLALNDPDRRAASLNSDLEKINSWAKQWKVSFLEEKTELLTIKKDNHPVFTHCHLEILLSKTRNITNTSV